MIMVVLTVSGIIETFFPGGLNGEIGALQVPWNSMEFHWTFQVSEIGALQVPWNSIEFHGTSRVSEIGTL